MKKILEALRAAHTAATRTQTYETPEDMRAMNKDLADKPLPMPMYEATYTYQSNVLVKGEVKEITVTRFGISRDLGATAPSISFTSWDGHKARGSVEMFYVCKEHAQAEVDHYLAEAAREKANEDLDVLVREYLPAILNLAEGAK